MKREIEEKIKDGRGGTLDGTAVCSRRVGRSRLKTARAECNCGGAGGVGWGGVGYAGRRTQTSTKRVWTLFTRPAAAVVLLWFMGLCI